MVIYTGEKGMEKMNGFILGLMIDNNYQKFKDAGYDPTLLKQGLFSDSEDSRNFTKDVINNVIREIVPNKEEYEDKHIIKDFLKNMDDTFFPEFEHIRKETKK